MRALLPLMLLCAGSSALASPRQELAQTKQAIEQSKARQAEAQARTKKIQSELRALQDKLVGMAKAQQKAESELAQAEEKLKALAEEEQKQDAVLQARRKELSAMVSAALRLSSTPQESMVIMPGDPLKTMKAARALKMTSDSIREETQSLARQLDELTQLRAKLENGRQELLAKRTQLAADQQEMEKGISQRKALQAQLSQQQKEDAKKLAQLSRKAEDLQDLIATAEKEEREARQAQMQSQSKGQVDSDNRPPAGTRGRLRSFAAAKGQIRTPAAGSVIQLFGVQRGRNETSKGIVIDTRNGAQVTAPFDGEVLFAGPFRGYGQIIILRHSDEFHTLIAGLAKIDAGVGQFLLEGEPIGAMGEGDPGTRLYLELRKNNQPIDPAPWIRGLNKKT